MFLAPTHRPTCIDAVERYGSQAALLVFDIDNFKSINDWYGHVVGDRVLQGVCGLLSSKVRSSDIVARWGGDEFVVILWHATHAGAAAKASALENAIACLRVPVSEQMLSVTASAGVTVIRPEDTPIKAMGRANLDMMLRKKARKQLDRPRPTNAASALQLRVA